MATVDFSTGQSQEWDAAGRTCIIDNHLHDGRQRLRLLDMSFPGLRLWRVVVNPMDASNTDMSQNELWEVTGTRCRILHHFDRRRNRWQSSLDVILEEPRVWRVGTHPLGYLKMTYADQLFSR